MVRIGFQRALIPNLRELVVAELAIGIPDQIGHIRVIVVAERLQLLDSGGIVVAFINGRIRRTVALRKTGVVDTGLVVGLLALLAGFCTRSLRISGLRGT